jgi:hypothetical protein
MGMVGSEVSKVETEIQRELMAWESTRKTLAFTTIKRSLLSSLHLRVLRVKSTNGQFKIFKRKCASGLNTHRQFLLLFPKRYKQKGCLHSTFAALNIEVIWRRLKVSWKTCLSYMQMCHLDIWTLVSVGDPGSNSLWTPRYNCTGNLECLKSP